MTGQQFEALVAWWNEAPTTRFLKIDYGLYTTGKALVMDTQLNVGQFVSDVSEIDLLAEKRKRLLESIEELEQLDTKKESVL